MRVRLPGRPETYIFANNVKRLRQFPCSVTLIEIGPACKRGRKIRKKKEKKIISIYNSEKFPSPSLQSYNRIVSRKISVKVSSSRSLMATSANCTSEMDKGKEPAAEAAQKGRARKRHIKLSALDVEIV
ncbi:hypothetical protein PUN28_004685 [Cardiocondyla obscurior]|uniref:Uncharacterized protein n=1 Tax=Cardiocondyla obscurior TaxID=286306 RepID=A0AAW2GI74_9HYME